MSAVAPDAVVWDCLRGVLVTRALALAAMRIGGGVIEATCR